MATKLSKEVLNMKMDHNGVQIPVGLCIKLAESTANDIELYPYLISLLFFAQGRRLNDLFRECQRLKTLHGAAPFSLPISPTISDEDDAKLETMTYHEQADYLAENYGLEPDSLEGAAVCYYLCKDELPFDYESRHQR